MGRRFLLLLLAIAPIFAGLVELNAVTYSLYSRPQSGIDIDLDLAWDKIPFNRDGYLPMQVRIFNRGTKDGVWQLTTIANSGRHMQDVTMKSFATLRVPAGEKRTFKLLAPYAKDDSHHNLGITLTGTGISEPVGQHFNSNRYHHGNLVHYGGIASDLYSDFGSRLDSKARSLGEEIHFVQVDPRLSPDDWRAYQAFNKLYFSDKSWDELAPPARRAILDWVSTGGELRLLVGSKDFDLGLSDIPAGDRVRRVGMGDVVLFQGDEDAIKEQIDHEATYKRTRHGREETHTREALFDHGYDGFFNFRFSPNASDAHRYDRAMSESDAAMAEMLSRVNQQADGVYEDSVEIDGANFTLIILSVIAFGVIVGPVNFFMLAKGRNRWRVFITIPAISIVFCVLIVGSIVLSDGFGGEGKTSRLVVIDPHRKSKVYVQDELSVTGILMNGGFETPESAAMQHLGSRLPESGMDAAGSFQQEGVNHAGSYYESRRLQHNRLIDVAPSREAIIVQGDPEAPELLSNLQASCSTVFFRGDDGRFWKVDNLGVGRTATAKPSSSEEFQEWWRDRKLEGGAPWLFSDYRGFAGQKGWFYADAQPVRDAYPETLGSINWTNHQTIIAGPLVKKGDS